MLFTMSTVDESSCGYRGVASVTFPVEVASIRVLVIVFTISTLTSVAIVGSSMVSIVCR